MSPPPQSTVTTPRGSEAHPCLRPWHRRRSRRPRSGRRSVTSSPSQRFLPRAWRCSHPARALRAWTPRSSRARAGRRAQRRCHRPFPTAATLTSSNAPASSLRAEVRQFSPILPPASSTPRAARARARAPPSPRGSGGGRCQGGARARAPRGEEDAGGGGEDRGKVPDLSPERGCRRSRRCRL